MARQRNKETDEISRKLDASKRTAERLVKQGMTLDDVDELRSAKHQKLLVEIATLEEKLAKMRRDLILRTEALQHGMRLADILNQLSGECITNWPTELAGKNEIQVREIVSRTFGEFNERFIEAAKEL
jgi:hypothetical protein